MTIHTRIITLVAASIAAITLSSTHATAQPFIQIEVSGTMEVNGTAGEFLPFGFRAILDAGAAPDLVAPNSIHFDAVWGEAIQTVDLASTSLSDPFVLVTDPLEYTPLSIEFVYDQSQNGYQLSSFLGGEFMVFTVGDPLGAFSLAMTSLPDAPGDYQRTQLSSELVSYSSNKGFANTGPFGSIGTITVTIQVVDGPPEPECIADFNGDGNLDFFDVSAYITLYSNGCP